MARLFLSYARQDLARLKPLIARLKKSGHEVWVDVEGEEGGEQWRARIVQEIEKCDAVVLALSARSIASDNVRRELDIAVDEHKKLIPVQLAHVDIPSHMKYQLTGLEYVDLAENREQGIDKVLRAIGTPTMPPVDPAVDENARRRRNGWLALMAVVALIGGMLVVQEFVGCPDSSKQFRDVLLGAHAQAEADYRSDGNARAYQMKLADLRQKASQLDSACFRDTPLASTGPVGRAETRPQACPQLWSSYDDCVDQRKKDSVLGKVTPLCPPVPDCPRR